MTLAPPGSVRALVRWLDGLLADTILVTPRLGAVPVFAYHHVGLLAPDADPPLTMDPEMFARQLNWLAEHGFTGIGASAWLDGDAGRTTFPERPVVITFDDGYAELTEHALPILERHGFGATVFVVTGLLGGSNVWDHASGRAAYALLDEAAIRDWAARGIEFGGHTRSHRRLVGLSDDELQAEVAGCRSDLESVLGAAPRAFAYPWGEADAAAKRLVARLFDVAFIADEGRNGRHADRHWLRRSGVLQVDSSTDLALRLQIGWTLRHRLRQRARRRLGRLRRRLAKTARR